MSREEVSAIAWPWWLDEDEPTGYSAPEERRALRRHLEEEHGLDLGAWPDAGIALLAYWHRLEHSGSHGA